MPQEELKRLAIQKGYASKRRHIFLCMHGKCTASETAEQLWNYLKKRLNELEPDSSTATVARSKVDCLRICIGGPTALVYPEGTLTEPIIIKLPALSVTIWFIVTCQENGSDQRQFLFLSSFAINVALLIELVAQPVGVAPFVEL